MSRYTDIDALTREVLASVEEDTSEKTASVVDSGLKTEVGLAIKAAAQALRGYSDNAVTAEDLRTVVEGAKLAAAHKTAGLVGGTLGAMAGGAVGGPLGAIGGAMAGNALGNKLSPAGAPNPATALGAPQLQQPQMHPSSQVRTASPLADEIRKLAAEIRDSGSRNEEVRLTKAAQMLTAAVGLEHLMEGLK